MRWSCFYNCKRWTLWTYELIFSALTTIVSKILKTVDDRNREIFPVWTIFFYDFNAFYMQHLNCIFSIQTILTKHDYFITVTHTLHLSRKKNILTCDLMIRNFYYLPPLSQLRSLFTSELSASGIVVYAVIKKLYTLVTKKIDTGIGSLFFSEMELKSIET